MSNGQLAFIVSLLCAIALPSNAVNAADSGADVQGAANARLAGNFEEAQRQISALLIAEVDQIPVRLEQARLYASQGKDDEAIRWLHRTLDIGGNTAWPAARDEPVFRRIQSHPAYQGLLKRMQPCAGGQFEALAYIAGRWEVTSTGNPNGPNEFFEVTEKIEGCAYYADYGTTAGYKYVSLIFYDPKTETWHQRGVDNQGFPMHMEGKMEGVDLVLRYQDGDTLYKSIFRRIDETRMHNEIQRSRDTGESWSRFFLGEFVRADKA